MSTPNANASDRNLIDAAKVSAMRLMQSPTLAARPSNPDDSAVGGLLSDSFAGYQVVREVHRGGQGIVFQAIQQGTNRKVAIKVMREGLCANDRERTRFEREVQILAQLNHPAIVRINESGTVNGLSYYVMDYISGHPLDVYTSDAGRSQRAKLELFARVCEAVNAAHLHGVIHRDLKPGNVRVDANGDPYVLDFGLAKVAGWPAHADEPQLCTMTGQFVGSLPWASPEQAEGVPGKIDIRTDVYSLGVMLYHMLTGRFPYGIAGNMRDVLDNIMKAQPVRPRSLRRDIDDEVETIVLKCLAKERERRYQSAGDLARDIRRYLAGQPIEAKRDSTWYVARKALVRRKWQVAAVAAAAAMLGTGSGLWAHARKLDRLARAQRVKALVDTDWANDSKEVEDLYKDFFTRLKAAETTPEENELFLSNAIRLELDVRRLAGLDIEWNGGVKPTPRFNLEDHGVRAVIDVAYTLGDNAIKSSGWLEFGAFGGNRGMRWYTKTLRDIHLRDVFGDAELPRKLPLRAACSVTFHWKGEGEEEKHWSSGPPGPASRLPWTGQRVIQESVTIFSRLPEHYPLAVSDTDTARQMEAAFKPITLWVKCAGPSAGTFGFEFGFTGPVPMAGKLQVLDPTTGAVLSETRLHTASVPDSISFGWWNEVSRTLPETYRALVQRGELKTARIRVVPDRAVAYREPSIQAYFGLPLEQTVAVHDEEERERRLRQQEPSKP